MLGLLCRFAPRNDGAGNVSSGREWKETHKTLGHCEERSDEAILWSLVISH